MSILLDRPVQGPTIRADEADAGIRSLRLRGIAAANVAANPAGYKCETFPSDSGAVSLVWCTKSGLYKNDPQISEDSPTARHLAQGPETFEGQTLVKAKELLVSAFAQARAFFPSDLCINPIIAVTGLIGVDGMGAYPTENIVALEHQTFDRLLREVDDSRRTGKADALAMFFEDMKSSFSHEMAHIYRGQNGEETPSIRSNEQAAIAIQSLASARGAFYRYIETRNNHGEHLQEAGKGAKQLQLALLEDAGCQKKPLGSGFASIYHPDTWARHMPKLQLWERERLQNEADTSEYLWGPPRKHLTAQAYAEVFQALDSVSDREACIERIVRRILSTPTSELDRRVLEPHPHRMPQGILDTPEYAELDGKIGLRSFSRVMPGETRIAETPDGGFTITLSDYDAAMLGHDTESRQTLEYALQRCRRKSRGEMVDDPLGD
jgi:hypothetical protein